MSSPEDERALDLDKFFEQHVEFGRYQLFVIALLLPACAMDAYMTVAIIFMLYKPKHRCKLSANETLDGDFGTDEVTRNFSINATHFKQVRADECSLEYSLISTANESAVELETTSCVHGWLFEQDYFESTLVSQFNLVCDREAHVTIMLTILGVAGIIGGYPLSWIQDKYGRRRGFLACTSPYIVFGLLSLLSPNFWVFTTLRFLSALPSLACFNACYIWGLEFVGPNKRTLASTIMCVVYGVATLFYGVIGYLCKTWIQIGLATTVPFAVSFACYFLVDESPRWLLSHGRVAEAKAVLTKISRWEGASLIIASFDKLTSGKLSTISTTSTSSSVSTETENVNEHRYTFVDLFRGRNVRLKTIILMFSHFAINIVYVTIAYNVPNLGGNLFVAFTLQAGAECSGAFVNVLLLNRCGRIWPLAAGMILSGVACVLTTPGDLWPHAVIVGLATVGKLCIGSSYAAIYQVTSELYPTVIRATGSGFSTLIAELSSLVMPAILLSGSTYRMMPMIILGVLAIVGGFCVFLLPETRDLAMPQTIEEGEEHADVGVAALRANFAVFAKSKLNCVRRRRRKIASESAQQPVEIVSNASETVV